MFHLKKFFCNFLYQFGKLSKKLTITNTHILYLKLLNNLSTRMLGNFLTDKNLMTLYLIYVFLC